MLRKKLLGMFAVLSMMFTGVAVSVAPTEAQAQSYRGDRAVARRAVGRRAAVRNHRRARAYRGARVRNVRRARAYRGARRASDRRAAAAYRAGVRRGYRY